MGDPLWANAQYPGISGNSKCTGSLARRGRLRAIATQACRAHADGRQQVLQLHPARLSGSSHERDPVNAAPAIANAEIVCPLGNDDSPPQTLLNGPSQRSGRDLATTTLSTLAINPDTPAESAIANPINVQRGFRSAIAVPTAEPVVAYATDARR